MEIIMIITLIVYILAACIIILFLVQELPIEEWVDAYRKWKNKHLANIDTELELYDVYILVLCNDIIGGEEVFDSEEYIDACENYKIVIVYNQCTGAVTIITTDSKQSVFIDNGLVHQLIEALVSING